MLSRVQSHRPLQAHQRAHYALRVPLAHHLVLMYQLALARVVQVLTHLRVHQCARYALLVRLARRPALVQQLAAALCLAHSDLTLYLERLQMIPRPLLSALCVQLVRSDLL